MQKTTKADWIVCGVMVAAAVALLAFMFWFSCENPVNPAIFNIK
jgi:hypothetical protein